MSCHPCQSICECISEVDKAEYKQQPAESNCCEPLFDYCVLVLAGEATSSALLFVMSLSAILGDVPIGARNGLPTSEINCMQESADSERFTELSMPSAFESEMSTSKNRQEYNKHQRMSSFQLNSAF